MKKILCCFLLISCFLLFSGCDMLKQSLNTSKPNSTVTDSSKSSDTTKGTVTDDTKEGSTSPTSSPIYTIKDYYPINSNVKYIYSGNGSKSAAYKMWIDYTKGNKVQLRVNNGGYDLVKVLETSNGELKLVQQRENCTYREDFTSKPSNKDEILLKEPLVKGTCWTLSDGRKRYISNDAIEVSTPLGSYKALEVTTEGQNNGSKTLDYYSLNIGLVKTISSGSDSSQIISSLSNIESNSPIVQNIKFYYPNIIKDKLYYTTKSVSFNTNDITKMILEKDFKASPSKELGKLLGPNVKILSLYLNKDNMVYIDFSKELVTEMNAGSGYESMILQSITNTLGDYYGVNKVYITIENKPYSSGHILKEKGEPFIVNKQNCVEIEK